MNSSFIEDTEKFRDRGSVVENGTVWGTPCLRLDLTCPGPLSKRPRKLDSLLARAAALIGDRFNYYGAESDGLGFSASRGRKPRVSDVEQLARVSEIMAEVEAEDAREKVIRKKSLLGLGVDVQDGVLWQANDCGTMGLLDRFPVAESGSHIQLIGFGGWGISVAFDLDLVLERSQEILKLSENFLVSGLGSSGSLSFAYNISPNIPAEFAKRIFLPLSSTLNLVNFCESAGFRFLPGDLGVLPMAPWYWMDRDSMALNGIPETELLELEPQVFQIREAGSGYLVKLYETPSLGLWDSADPTERLPAKAFSKVLETALRGKFDKAAIKVGESHDDQNWLCRFC